MRIKGVSQALGRPVLDMEAPTGLLQGWDIREEGLGQGAMKMEAAMARGSVAFLFFGELFLIPHLLPIAAALARKEDPPAITLFVLTSVHEEILRAALTRLGIADIAIRRANGFRLFPPGTMHLEEAGSKLLVLARNAIAIMGFDVVVVAERTSLWLPRLTRGKGAAFIYNEHGAGPHANFSSRRNRYAARILMPGSGMADRVRESGHGDAPIAIVGYIKRDYMREVSSIGAPPPFAEARPTVIYVPHWLRPKSSWWGIGEKVLDYFARSDRYNLILAPHIRLPSFDPSFEDRVRPYRDCPNIHVDATSFSLIDQTYINAADIYLGDGSSQVVEYAERPRPAIFLNPERIDWRNDPRFSHWTMGDVVEGIEELDEALMAAPAAHHVYGPVQQAYVERMMGVDDGRASIRAAEVVLDVLARK
jgi:hypothetical protein